MAVFSDLLNLRARKLQWLMLHWQQVLSCSKTAHDLALKDSCTKWLFLTKSSMILGSSYSCQIKDGIPLCKVLFVILNWRVKAKRSKVLLNKEADRTISHSPLEVHRRHGKFLSLIIRFVCLLLRKHEKFYVACFLWVSCILHGGNSDDHSG